MSPHAILFDIDGTLVDSNFLHIEAWARAFYESGFTVPSWKIQRAIGADSTELLKILVGEESDETKDRVKDLHSTFYEDLMPRIQLLDGARDLVAAVASRDVRVVLATSAPEKELEALLRVLDIDDTTYAVTSSEDVETAKPKPDIIEVALDKGGISAENAIMIGDSTWDIIAANRAGVRAIGLLSGGTGASDLREAGAIAVYDSVADVLDKLDVSPLAEFWSA